MTRSNDQNISKPYITTTTTTANSNSNSSSGSNSSSITSRAIVLSHYSDSEKSHLMNSMSLIEWDLPRLYDDDDDDNDV